jgi:hypothetical protein
VQLAAVVVPARVIWSGSTTAFVDASVGRAATSAITSQRIVPMRMRIALRLPPARRRSAGNRWPPFYDCRKSGTGPSRLRHGRTSPAHAASRWAPGGAVIVLQRT